MRPVHNRKGECIMQIHEFTITFTTPAFVGDAEQKGQWRTPPFKAMLRQWWRVARAVEMLDNGEPHGRLHEKLREEEGRLFGHAWLKDRGGKQWAMRSRVKIRLDEWRMGTCSRLNNEMNVSHPEVHRPQGIGSFLYLGYGPVTFRRGQGTALKKTPAINEGESMHCKIAFPTGSMDKALLLADWFGGVGGRSGNGWGSVQLTGDGLDSSDFRLMEQYSRDFEDCMKLDWRHAIGKDGKGLLVWKTQEYKTWQDVMKKIAEIKIAVRTQFAFKSGGLHDDLYPRHILAYPVTKHGFKPWGNNSRSSNQLLFKVHRQHGRYLGIAVHLPHAIPHSLQAKIKNNHIGLPHNASHSKKDVAIRKLELATWRHVHKKLDELMERMT